MRFTPVVVGLPGPGTGRATENTIGLQPDCAPPCLVSVTPVSVFSLQHAAPLHQKDVHGGCNCGERSAAPVLLALLFLRRKRLIS